MCVYSMVMDKGLSWPKEWWNNPLTPVIFKDMMDGARQYDQQNGEPDCELAEKKAALQKLADELGIKINFDFNLESNNV